MELAQFFSYLPVLETERLILRRITWSDAKDFNAYARDRDVAQHVLWEPHASMADTLWSICYYRGLYRRGRPSCWAIEEKSRHRMIGTIGFMVYSAEHQMAEVGYSLSKDCWNRGLMTEALTTVRDFVFTNTETHRIQAMVEADHPASLRVLEKCGFRREGVLRGSIRNKGRFSDVWMTAILREDWEKTH